MNQLEREILAMLCVIKNADTDEKVEKVRFDFMCALSKVNKVEERITADIETNDVLKKLGTTYRKASLMEQLNQWWEDNHEDIQKR